MPREAAANTPSNKKAHFSACRYRWWCQIGFAFLSPFVKMCHLILVRKRNHFFSLFNSFCLQANNFTNQFKKKKQHWISWVLKPPICTRCVSIPSLLCSGKGLICSSSSQHVYVFTPAASLARLLFVPDGENMQDFYFCRMPEHKAAF